MEVSVVDETAKGDGVGREVYFTFLEHLLQVAFDGREEYAPIVLPQFGEEEYEVVGKIFYHFFINFTLFPVQFCEVSLHSVFIGQYSEQIVIESFFRFISRKESSAVTDACKVFTWLVKKGEVFLLTRIKLSQNPLLVYQLRGVNLTYQRDKFIPIPYCRYMAEV